MAYSQKAVIYQNDTASRDIMDGLTYLQSEFVRAYLGTDGDINIVAKMLDITRSNADKMLGSEKVRNSIHDRKMNEPGKISRVRGSDDLPYNGASREEKLDMLWNLARKSSGMIYDKEGNEIIMNGAVAVSAVRTMNDMVGDWAPKEANIKVDIKDDRSIEEVKASVAELMAEFTTLAGEVSGEIKAIEDVPSLDLEKEM